MEGNYVENTKGLIQSMYQLADNLEAQGIGNNIPFVDKKEGLRGAVKNDYLVFLLTLADTDKQICQSSRYFINECLGCEFSELALEVARHKVMEAKLPQICMLVPYMILIDKQIGGNKYSSVYVQTVCYIALGYLQSQEHTSLEEIVRYERYASGCIQLIEKALCCSLDFDPLTLLKSDKIDLIRKAINIDKQLHKREDDPVIKALEAAIIHAVNNSNGDKERAKRSNEIIIDMDKNPGDDSELLTEETDEHSSSSEKPNNLQTKNAALATAMEEMDALIGLSEVKQQVKTLVNVFQVRRRCKELNIKRPAITLHMIFTGNPGTGKTSVARILGKIYKEAGLLSSGHMVEVSRVDLVGKYVGHTATMVKDVFDRAKGGILFIDEAYSLTSESGQGGYGKEAVETLLKLMEDNREDIAVIAAGYPSLMQEFLDSNPGFRSRFPFVIRFPEYTGEELTEIFKSFCKENDIVPTSVVVRAVRNHFEAEALKKTSNYGNGRAVRNYFEQMIMNQANRLTLGGNYGRDELCTFIREDLPRKMILKPSLYDTSKAFQVLK